MSQNNDNSIPHENCKTPMTNISLRACSQCGCLFAMGKSYLLSPFIEDTWTLTWSQMKRKLICKKLNALNYNNRINQEKSKFIFFSEVHIHKIWQWIAIHRSKQAGMWTQLWLIYFCSATRWQGRIFLFTFQFKSLQFKFYFTYAVCKIEKQSGVQYRI